MIYEREKGRVLGEGVRKGSCMERRGASCFTCSVGWYSSYDTLHYSFWSQ